LHTELRTGRHCQRTRRRGEQRSKRKTFEFRHSGSPKNFNEIKDMPVTFHPLPQFADRETLPA
jgi:hypothetical protein